jgi:uncharacterized protein (DUF302 family)
MMQNSPTGSLTRRQSRGGGQRRLRLLNAHDRRRRRTVVRIVAAKGLVVLQSGYGPEETMNRFEDEVRARGMTVFAHIDHAAVATAVGLSLDPTDLLIFGDPKTSANLTQQKQVIGADLPPRVLVWRDPSGLAWLSYSDVVAKRHSLRRNTNAGAASLSVVVTAIARAATGSL